MSAPELPAMPAGDPVGTPPALPGRDKLQGGMATPPENNATAPLTRLPCIVRAP